ncbi:MAG: hypothetical protein WD907_00870, partial [Bacilli bacterium]
GMFGIVGLKLPRSGLVQQFIHAPAITSIHIISDGFPYIILREHFLIDDIISLLKSVSLKSFSP